MAFQDLVNKARQGAYNLGKRVGEEFEEHIPDPMQRKPAQFLQEVVTPVVQESEKMAGNAAKNVRDRITAFGQREAEKTMDDPAEGMRPEDYKFSESPIALLAKSLYGNTPMGRQTQMTDVERGQRYLDQSGAMATIKIKNPYTGEIEERPNPIKQLAESSGFGSYLTENPLALMGTTGGVDSRAIFDDVTLWDDFTKHAGDQLDYYKAPNTTKMIRDIKYDAVKGKPMAEVQELIIRKVPKAEQSEKVFNTIDNWIKSNAMKWLNKKGLLE